MMAFAASAFLVSAGRLRNIAGMILTRRDALMGAAAMAAGLVPQLATAQPAATPLPLGPWTYGKGSHATDTVLMFRGNPAHTFYGTGPIPDRPRLHWRHRMAELNTTLRGKPITWAGTGWTGSASKLGDYVYVGSVGGVLYCYEAATGKVMWTLKGGRMFKSSVCIYDNKIYVGNVDDQLRCVDAATGQEVWRFDTGRDLDSSPCVVDGRLYIAGENGYVRCIDPLTGKEIWKTFVDGIGPGTVPGSNGSESSPAIADGELYTSTYDGILFSIATEDGRVRWKAKLGDDTDASQAISGDFVYAASEEKAPYLYCFARENGREVWRYTENKVAYYSTPAVVGERVYVGGDDSNLHCVDARTGKGIWTFRTGDAVWSSPCVVDGKVVFGSKDAHLYILDAMSGHELWRYKADGRFISSPCIVGGYIWIGTATGWFYCFGP
jgi:outer membrane protein assembly factor BamB